VARANFRNFREFPGAGANFRDGREATILHVSCNFVITHNPLQSRLFLTITRFQRARSTVKTGPNLHHLDPGQHSTKPYAR
jgi:hypothetical protein